MATTSKRALWKGAISFGLVHIPIALHSATQEQGLDFDWLDKRSMDPVGYKRINKATGKEIARENIVKGIEYQDGQYVVLSQEEIQAAYPKTTQTVEIEAFVPLSSIPFIYLERPYYMSPINKGGKVYALLREVLHKTRKVGIAKVVIQTKQHLAILMPCGPALILNLLRWDDEIRSWDELSLPAEGARAAGLTDKEMAMGEQLVADMSAKWQPQAFTDSFKDQILQLVKEKVEAGETEAVSQPEEQGEDAAGAKIYDLTEMLQRSLNKGTRTPAKADGARTPRKPAAKPAAKAAARASGKSARPAPAAKSPAAKSGAPSSGGKTAKKAPAAKKSAKPTPPKGRKAA
ncbi:non-homologous end joining protein Ku [Pollutimonas bauzanensis]|uniref:Non-homologous end joining protein Ku n=1 Tax=Pollutimonas bauzanensis TaxID=658167 RepID=A0A1M5YZJ4_9BURK|nr:Ku protein [Pollutimonas bauzanensis]SHI17380.1 DNA end-binding protein Ku [Pollutimonas bauzanensis]